jgi:hypothetical protein
MTEEERNRRLREIARIQHELERKEAECKELRRSSIICQCEFVLRVVRMP